MFTNFLTLMPMFVTLLWALVLLNTSKHNKAKKVLGLFMLATSLLFTTHLVYYNGLKSYYLVFDLMFMFCSLVIYPLYYLYIKVLAKCPRIYKKDYLLFLPAVLQMLAVAVVYALMSNDLRSFYINHYLFGKGEFVSAHILIKTQLVLIYILQLVYFIQIVFSSYKIHQYISRYNSNIENYYSNIDEKTIEWHKLILYSFLIISILSVFYNFMGRSYFSQSSLALALPSVTYTILLFVFGYLGNLQNYNVANFNAEKSVSIETEESQTADCTPEIQTKIPTELSVMQKVIADIKTIIEAEELYQKPDFKITDLAEKLNSNRTYISNAINANCGCTFNTFINKYRIDKAKKLLASPENNPYSLEHIASLCGFANLHTFMRVFKEAENTTPGKYRIFSQEDDKIVS